MVYESQRETLTFRSSVKPRLMNLALKRGALFGGVGAFILLLGGSLLSVDQLKIWGIPIFLIGITLIAIGILPYKKLNSLQTNPHMLLYDGQTLIFCKKGKPLLKIAEKNIDRIEYLEKANLYGIGVWLKFPINDKVKVLQPHFDYVSFTTHSREHFQGCDLFFPYFSERSFNELMISTDQLGSNHAT